MVTLFVSLLALEGIARLVVPAEIFSFGPVYAEDSTIGYRFKPNRDEYAFGAQLKTNQLGFRGPEWTQTKPPQTFRIALIGDSFAFGFGVEYPQTYGEQLAAKLEKAVNRPVEVLNFGVPGFNSQRELEVLRACALPFEPDLVITLLVSNDHEADLHVDPDGYLQYAANARVESEFVPRRNRWGFLRHSALLTWAKLTWSNMQAKPEDEPTGDEFNNDWTAELIPGPIPTHLQESLLQPLLAMHGLCAAEDTPFVLASFAASQDYRRVVDKFTSTTASSHLDLVRLFPETVSWKDMVQKFGLGWDSHPNAEAHGRWATATAELLVAAGLIRPN